MINKIIEKATLVLNNDKTNILSHLANNNNLGFSIDFLIHSLIIIKHLNDFNDEEKKEILGCLLESLNFHTNEQRVIEDIKTVDDIIKILNEIGKEA